MMGTHLNDADANDVGLDDKLLFSLLRSTQVVVIPPSDMGTCHHLWGLDGNLDGKM